MRTNLHILLAILLLGLLASACSPAAPLATEEPVPETAPATLIVTDDLGRELELEGPVARIVTLGPSVVESLFALGAGERIVGREEFSLYPPEAQEIPSVGSLFGELPSEAILALEPDLVIAPEIISQEQVQALEALGLTVYYQTNPQSFPELYTKLRELAFLTDTEAEAEILIEDLSARVQAVESALEGVEPKRVFYELDATDPENPYTTGAGTFIDTLIAMAGGENIGRALEGAYAQVSSEEVIVADPQVILLADAEYGITPEVVAARPGWQGITAVLEEQVYPFDPNLGSIPGPRLVEGLEGMARLIHPERFE